MASFSGTRRQAGVSCGSTRRILTPFHFFHQLRDTTQCTHCNIVRGFQVIKRETSGNTVSLYHRDPPSFHQDYNAPVTYLLRCPVCEAFKQWIVYEFEYPDDEGDDEGEYRHHYFKVTSVPSEGLEDIDELPDDRPLCILLIVEQSAPWMLMPT
jgi:hypothetical protein